ncbi:MAG: depupylase/deamidase Dop [Nitrospirota bacterium]
MLKRKILGSEVEYGIATKDMENLDQVSNSTSLINNYPYLPSAAILWDYEGENPFVDARGFEVQGEKERPTPDYNRAINKLLANGGRLYVDGAHPEYSTPECSNARDVVLYEKAGDRIVDICRKIANQFRSERDKFIIYKNNTDGKGNSYGYHENYLVKRIIPFGKLMEQLVPFFVTRQIYAGAGKVSYSNKECPYQISQRADFFEVLVDLNTMVKRPIMNTRDEPHADPEKYRRLHVIVGDSNMSEFTSFLKIGTTDIVLSMIEDGIFLKGLELETPVRAMKDISRDTSLKKRIKLSDGRKLTAIEIQREYLEKAVKYAASIGSEDVSDVTLDVLKKWEYVLERLEKEPMELSREIDWIIKRDLLLSYIEKKGCNWSNPDVSMINLQYHDIRLDKGLYYTLERNGRVERIIEDEDIEEARDIPPSDTRAYFRGICLKKFPKDVYAASWSSLLFDIGNTTLKKIPLLEPLRGTKELTKKILQESDSIEELLSRITT